MSRHVVDTVVVGGGAMGSAAAWQLARRGIETVLLERFEPGHTNGASHGSSRIFRTSYAEPTYIRLALEAQGLWTELEELTGTSLLTVTGGVDHGGNPQLEATAEALDILGLPFRRLSVEEAGERWPGLRFDQRVLFYPNSGRLHADLAVEALQRSAVDHGAHIAHVSPVTRIDVRDDNSALVRTLEDEFVARRVVVAAGAWTAGLVGDLVTLPPIRVTQEQPAHFAPIDVDTQWPSFVHAPLPGGPEDSAYGGVYGLSSGAEGVKVGFHGTGPQVDPDHRDFRAEPKQFAALREHVRRWLPGVDPDDFEPISCTYATTPDSNFIIDRSGPIVIAAGFSGHGFKFVPAIGRLLADLAAEEPRTAPAIFSLTHHSDRKVAS